MYKIKVIVLSLIFANILNEAQAVSGNSYESQPKNIGTSKATTQPINPSFTTNLIFNKIQDLVVDKIKDTKFVKKVQKVQKTMPHLVRILQNSVYSDLINIIVPASIGLVAGGVSLYMYKCKNLPIPAGVAFVIFALSPLLYKYEVFSKIFFNKTELKEIEAVKKFKMGMKMAKDPGIFSDPFLKFSDLFISTLPLMEVLSTFSKEEDFKK